MRKKNLDIKPLFGKKEFSGKKIIVSVSGGVDSMLLLELLRPHEDQNIIVIHVHHGLRKTADRDENIVREYCKKYDLKLEILHANVAKEAKKTKTTIEECGRNIRHEFLEKMRKKHKATWIATAHHADDQIETLLYRIIKGTSITGLVGIKPISGHYIRPLIEWSKRDILECAKKNKILFGHDETNDDISIPRNLIRHQILPLMQKINPETGRALLRFSEYSSELKKGFDDFFVHETTNQGNKKSSLGTLNLPAGRQGFEPGTGFSLDWYFSLPLGFQQEWLRTLYEKTHNGTLGLSKALIDEIRRFLKTRNGGQKKFGKITLTKKSGKVSYKN